MKFTHTIMVSMAFVPLSDSALARPIEIALAKEGIHYEILNAEKFFNRMEVC